MTGHDVALVILNVYLSYEIHQANGDVLFAHTQLLIIDDTESKLRSCKYETN